MRKGLDLVVTNYRTPGDLADFLQSLVDFPPTGDWGLTIANVCPTTEDSQVPNAFRGSLPVEKIMSYPANVGYAGACNRGGFRTQKQRSVMAFFNADVRVTEGSLDACYDALLAESDRGVLGPRQVDDHGKITHAGIFGSLDKPRHRGWKEQDRGQYVDTLDAVSVSGSAYFIRRETWDQLTNCPIYREVSGNAEGPFLPTNFYYEETFVSYHAAAHGWKVVYLGGATMIHQWHNSVKQNGAESWAAEQMIASKMLFREACDAHGIPHD